MQIPDQGQIRSVMIVSKTAHTDSRVLSEAQLLEQAGCQVTVLCWDREKRFPARTYKGSLEILDLGRKGKHGGRGGQLIHFFPFWMKCLGYLLTHSWDIVHCHDFDTLWPGLLAGKLRHKPVIFDGHEVYGELFSNVLPRPIADLLQKMEYWLTPKIDYLISPSERYADYYLRRGAPRHKIFENYKEPLDFTFPEEVLAQRRRELGLDGKFVLVYAGLLDTYACLDVLMEAVAQVPDVCLVIAGGGRLTPWMQEIASSIPNVSYLGLLPLNEAQKLVALADCVDCIVKMPPAMLGYGTALNKLYDALAAGKMVICSSQTPDIANLVREHGFGDVIEGDLNVINVKKGLEAIHQDRGRVSEMGIKAREACREHYNRARATENLYQVYKTCLPRFNVQILRLAEDLSKKASNKIGRI